MAERRAAAEATATDAVVVSENLSTHTPEEFKKKAVAVGLVDRHPLTQQFGKWLSEKVRLYVPLRNIYNYDQPAHLQATTRWVERISQVAGRVDSGSHLDPLHLLLPFALP